VIDQRIQRAITEAHSSATQPPRSGFN